MKEEIEKLKKEIETLKKKGSRRKDSRRNKPAR